jgi:hypothetical protein
MATANRSIAGKPGRNSARRGWRRRAGWFALLALAVLGLLYGASIRQSALAGASYGARMACSCRFVAARPLRDCRKDFEPGMALIMLSEDEAAKSVTARFPLLSRETATYREGWGCVLEAWRH